MKKSIAFMLLSGLCSLAGASTAELKLPDFEPLEHKAVETVNVDLGPFLIKSAGLFLDEKDPECAAAKTLLAGIRAVRIRHFKFAEAGAYPAAEIKAVRAQLIGGNWLQLVNVHDAHLGKDTNIYMSVAGERTNGFAIIDEQPREFTIISIVGSIRPEDLARVQKHLHLPGLRDDAPAPVPDVPGAQL